MVYVSANLLRTPKEADEYAGDFEISILARNAKDFQAIYDDIHNRKAQMNTSLADYELIYTISLTIR